MKPESSPDRSRREWLAVAALTVVGLALRSWPIGGLGLTHFDEGIYALAASWSLLPKGLAGIDPSLIPYSPPGYPILGGIAYLLLGRSDGAMIAVSQLAGTLTIPVVAWLGRRTLGSGVGFASATFCTFSGPHVATSRMALTDASFLLAWLIAIGAGMRFLERPGLVRSIAMGGAVGLAQQFKYNGWLVGGIVVASATWGVLVRPGERRAGSISKVLGWGGLAAVVAWLVVWPWYAFVEAHGGYPALLRHQRSYLGGFGDWWPNFLIQARQSIALSRSGGLWVVALACVFWTPWVIGRRVEVRGPDRARGLPSYLAMIPWGPFAVFLMAPYWLGLVAAPWLLSRPGASARLVGVWWLVLTLITPFYHPYARLWLPYHAVNWLIMGCVIANVFAPMLEGSRGGDKAPGPATPEPGRSVRPVVLVALLGLGLVPFALTCTGGGGPRPGLLDPSDSLYRAASRVAKDLPEEVRGLRLLARPPVTYYLGGRVALAPMADSRKLLDRGDPGVWALVDSAILRSEPGEAWEDGRLPDRYARNWEIVEELATTPSLPTLLDLDPESARSSRTDVNYPLWLLRPRTAKAPR